MVSRKTLKPKGDFILLLLVFVLKLIINPFLFYTTANDHYVLNLFDCNICVCGCFHVSFLRRRRVVEVCSMAYFICWHFFPFIFPLRLSQSMVVITVSQVEHGVLQLVDNENPQITVLVDCEGLSPLRVPMQILRSCSCLLQDHFPKRLGCLFVIKLPPVARVVAQTFIQVSFKFT